MRYKNGEIENTNVTKRRVPKKYYMYGKDAANLRAKSVQKKTNKIPHIEIIEIPKDLLPKLQNVNISIDLFYFLGRTFLHSISKKISFVSTERMLDELKSNLLRCTQN